MCACVCLCVRAYVRVCVTSDTHRTRCICVCARVREQTHWKATTVKSWKCCCSLSSLMHACIHLPPYPRNKHSKLRKAFAGAAEARGEGPGSSEGGGDVAALDGGECAHVQVIALGTSAYKDKDKHGTSRPLDVLVLALVRALAPKSCLLPSSLSSSLPRLPPSFPPSLFAPLIQMGWVF
jgi:hypothetical protein